MDRFKMQRGQNHIRNTAYLMSFFSNRKNKCNIWNVYYRTNNKNININTYLLTMTNRTWAKNSKWGQYVSHFKLVAATFIIFQKLFFFP